MSSLFHRARPPTEGREGLSGGAILRRIARGRLAGSTWKGVLSSVGLLPILRATAVLLAIAAVHELYAATWQKEAKETGPPPWLREILGNVTREVGGRERCECGEGRREVVVCGREGGGGEGEGEGEEGERGVVGGEKVGEGVVGEGEGEGVGAVGEGREGGGREEEIRWRREAEKIYKRNLWRRATWVGDASWMVRQRFLEFYTAATYPCFGERRFGNWTLGGQWLCRSNTLNRESVVYSIGESMDDSFIHDIYKSKGVQIHVVSPRVPRMSEAFFYHRVKTRLSPDLTSADFVSEALNRTMQTFARAKSVRDKLGHEWIDLATVNCGGVCHGASLRSFLEASKGREGVRVGQVLLHLRGIPSGDFAFEVLEAMEQLGYRLFHAEKNFYYAKSILVSYIHETLVMPDMAPM